MSADARCQHCDGAVEFRKSDRGFREFVHAGSGVAACPEVAARIDAFRDAGYDRAAALRDGYLSVAEAVQDSLTNNWRPA